MEALVLLQKQKFGLGFHSWRIGTVIDCGNFGSGHELPVQSELMIRQKGDERLACRDRFFPFEQQRQAVPCAGKCDAGPVSLAVTEVLYLPPARCSSALCSFPNGPRGRALGGVIGRSVSICMGLFPVCVHEMLHPFFRLWTWYAAVAQIEHEAGVACRKAAEFRRRHSGPTEESFNFADQHRRPVFAVGSIGAATIAVEILLV